MEDFTDEKKEIAEQSVAGATTVQKNSGSYKFIATQDRIEIPKLNVIGNVVYANTSAEAERLVDNNIVHLPQSAMPGSIGNAVYTAHSSNTVWNYYSNIFSTINKLESGDKILLYKGIDFFVYEVYNKEVISNKFEDIRGTSNEGLVLTTCWPIGTNNKRLVIYAERL